MKHWASPQFWRLYEALPADIRSLADKSFALLKVNSRHPSLHLKRIDKFWSVRVGDHYRAIGTDIKEGIYWVWIGTHADYDRLIG